MNFSGTDLAICFAVWILLSLGLLGLLAVGQNLLSSKGCQGKADSNQEGAGSN